MDELYLAIENFLTCVENADLSDVPGEMMTDVGRAVSILGCVSADIECPGDV